ncbi:snoRNA-binding rRNA-processing protein imp4 [Desmophyllum pertusum]|uniref:SnoRNA-binding rRNA-processing protein imp4 n=1 Tax=Desmophyllum pertusum TaxID=174260 RepID=A0A9W9Z7L6_9CNID|nr:snoRNA-binding rRNA-processing protein imp4 [Desmophyllum pertusum]
MLRRQARLRREYLYRKSAEEQERSTYERKKKLKTALEEGKPIPTELRKDEAALRKAIEFDDEKHEQTTSHQDDEYAWAGVQDPKIMITTSHSPSSRLKQFAQGATFNISQQSAFKPWKLCNESTVQACRANEVTDLILVHEHRGEPDGLVVSHLPFGPTAYFTLSNTVMRHDIPKIGTMSEAYPHLIFHNFNSKLGERVKNVLRYLYPVPKDDSRRVITFANQEDYISFRHHTYKKVDGQVELSEVGPRFEMKIYEIKLGTVDQNEADVEWRLRPYMNTSKKRKALSS